MIGSLGLVMSFFWVLGLGFLCLLSLISNNIISNATCESIMFIHRDQHHSSLLLHYSSLSYILLSIARYAGVYLHDGGPCGLLQSILYADIFSQKKALLCFEIRVNGKKQGFWV